MNSALAIAAITKTLRELLDAALKDNPPGVEVSTRPPDRVQVENGDNPIVNLFLYHVTVNPSWRNMDIPWRVKQGERGNAPLPLNLFYLLTTFSGEDNDAIRELDDRFVGNHRLLGQAMSVLHDHPVLTAAEIAAQIPSNDRADGHIYDQVENVRITPHPMSMDELSKIWTGFQTHYRLSAAYEVSVVLIESQREQPVPLPVLRRGPEDRGVKTAIGPFPTLEAIRRPPGARFGIQLGDTIELIGQNLGGETVIVRFAHPLREDGQQLTPAAGSNSKKLIVNLPAADAGTAATDWSAGFYGVNVVLSNNTGPDRTTNQVPMALSPIVQNINPNPAARDGEGNVSLTITCAPEILPDQQARLLLGEREIQSTAHPASTATLLFEISDAPAGEHLVRLRVDGVDSLPMKFNRNGEPGFDPNLPEGVPIFDPAQKVTIT